MRGRASQHIAFRLLAGAGLTVVFVINPPESFGFRAQASAQVPCIEGVSCSDAPAAPRTVQPAPPRQSSDGTAAAENGARRVALVIGELAYKNNALRLNSPGKDIDLIGAALKGAGFSVTAKRNLDDAALRNELRNFARAATAAEDAVIYFSGHGLSDQNDINYVLPVDSDVHTLDDLSNEGVPLDALANAVRPAKGLQLVIVDGCRDSLLIPAPGASGGVTARCFSPPEYKDARIVAFSSDRGSVLKDTAGPSPYAAALAEHLNAPGVEVSEMLAAVTTEVEKATNGIEKPQVFRTSLTPPRFFAPRAECDLNEDLAWSPVRSSAQLGEFLSRYPNGCHAKEARDRIASLKRTDEQQEAAAFSSIRDSNDLAALNAFVANFPASPHVKEVKGRITKLGDSAAKEEQAKQDEVRAQQRLASCPANLGSGDAQWIGECIGRLAPEVARAMQQARDAEAKARQEAAAGRTAQMRSMDAAAAARQAEQLARSANHPDTVVVQDFTSKGLGVYAGGIASGVRQGNGVWIDVKGERYEGEWSKDGRSGVGKTIPASGPIFEGTWKDGNPCGVGVLTWPNGDRYEGDYCNGHYSGYGIFYFSTSSNQNYARQNIGEWKADKQTGYGVRLWAGGTRSEGQWVDGKLVGYGAEFNQDGQIQTKHDIPQQGIYDADNLMMPLPSP